MKLETFGRIGLFALALVAATGCSATRATHYSEVGCPDSCTGTGEPLTYGLARGLDFLDMFELNVGVGRGLHAAAEIAPFRIGYGFSDTKRAGFMHRATGSWSESRQEFWLLQDFVKWDRSPCCGNAYMYDPCRWKGTNVYRDLDYEDPLARYADWGYVNRFDDHEKHWLDTGFEATLGCVTLDAFISPCEVLDFFLGWGMVDVISRDDYHANPEIPHCWNGGTY